MPPEVAGTIEGTPPEGAIGKPGMTGKLVGASGAGAGGEIVGATGSDTGGVGKTGGVSTRKATQRAKPEPATIRYSPVHPPLVRELDETQS